ncbi:hypothetical protein J4G33_12410 [Actinotalea sp. BY-33]|uniref:Sugar-binding cellulase-like protein n=1 Tax=Actinotalea soli TaxID=2819234 RepID=A0A939LQ26_9CELL|nr:cellulase-like family protein [Actinotalea soli]MBO1752607.1 hypothetical protein [Actinotalea soli]
MTGSTRFLGSGHEPGPATTGLTGPVPDHLPGRLTVCLWDFSWYTRAAPGEPYRDLDEAFAQTVHRGYNAVRICAAPVLLFGDLGLDGLATDLPVEGLGTSPGYGSYGQGTRWYDAAGGYRLDLRARFLELVATARRHGVVVILASWEYQQSPAFAADPAWFEALHAVPLEERYAVLGRATSRMLEVLAEHGLADAVAFTEIHNEVDFSLLPALAGAGERAVEQVADEHPGQLVTASYGKPPHLDMAAASPTLQVAQFHVYAYGVLDALQQQIDIRGAGDEGFPNATLRGLLRQDAPSLAEYGRPAAWKLEATVVTDQMVYGYDWIDPRRWDGWLYAHYGEHRLAMQREITSRVVAVTAWARRRGVPTVIGEGWVGYTPRDGQFEEGPVGTDLAELGVATALEHGVWGMVLSSNAAPHHPMWADVAWQQRVTGEILRA